MLDAATLQIWLWILGILFTVGMAGLGILVNRASKHQDARLEDIERHLASLNGFKDTVLANHITRSELNQHESRCGKKFSDLFRRMHDTEKVHAQ